MVRVHGRLYINVNYLVRNIGLILPFDPTSFGAPSGLVTYNVKPRLTTRMLLPLRLWRLYRETMHTYRVVMPRYRDLLQATYEQLRPCLASSLAELDLARIHALFTSPTLEDALAFLSAYALVGFLNSAMAKVVEESAPELLNLLVGHNTSTAMLGRRMWELRQTALQCGDAVCDRLREKQTDPDLYRDDPQASPLVHELDRFIQRYGYRAFRYASEFEATRLADQPDLVLLAVAGLLDQDEPPSVRAEAARQAGLAALQRLGFLRRLFWGRLLRWASALVERREENRDMLDLQSATYGLAARLLARHYFPDQPEDYLWLYTFAELISFAQSRGQKCVDPAEIGRRRSELGRDRRQPSPPELIWYDPGTGEWCPVENQREPQTQALATQVQLRGIGASAGSGPVQGYAVVTDDVEEAIDRLLDLSGPVALVTHVTDPAWSSLFGRLAAVVTEMGGAISHAAIVARENGIPAVVGVQEATRRIQNGQWIRVDGTAGTVEVIQEPIHLST